MAHHEDDMTYDLPLLERAGDKLAHHKYANVKNEFCYLQYADTEGYDNIRILPPVTKLEKTGHAIAHAVVCAVEARYHKARNRCYPPKSVWRFSVKSFIKTLSTRPKQEEGYWSITSINNAISESGFGLAADEDHPKQLGPKFHGAHLHSFKLENENQIDEVFEEIHKNGPVIALIQPLEEEDYKDWSSELAKERVYSGFSLLTKHAVALIGTSSFDDGSKYFIAQNCYGEEWGDKGVYRMMPVDIVEVVVPVLPGR